MSRVTNVILTTMVEPDENIAQLNKRWCEGVPFSNVKPFPEVGDECEFMNRKWIVTSIESAEIIATVPRVSMDISMKIQPCLHDRLNEDGICRKCGVHRRGI